MGDYKKEETTNGKGVLLGWQTHKEKGRVKVEREKGRYFKGEEKLEGR